MKTILWILFVVIIDSSVRGDGFDSTSNEDIVNWETHPRFQRGSDYGSNLGGPVAASGLPASIGPSNGLPPVDINVTNPCTGSTQCSYEMRAQQRLKNLKSINNELLGFATCDTIKACQDECDKRGCNYATLAGLTRPYLAHLYKMGSSDLSTTAKYQPASMFDSIYKSCSPASRKRTKRDLGDIDRPMLPKPDDIPPEHLPQPVTPPLPTLRPPNLLSTPSRPTFGSTPSRPTFGSTPSRPTFGSTPSRPTFGSHTPGNPMGSTPPGSLPPGSKPSKGTYFEKYNNNYKRKDMSDEERTRRAKAFDENVSKMDERNAKRKNPDDAACGLNQFSDEDRTTFSKKFGGATIDSKEDAAETVQLSQNDMSDVKTRPKSDWRQYNVVPPIRYQGSCGACYAFASADVIAAQNAIERRSKSKSKLISSDSGNQETVEPLSPQYLIDCSAPGAGMGCNGGRPIKVLEAVVADTLKGGVPLEACQKYQGKAGGSCPNDVSCCQRRSIQAAKMLDISGSKEKELMAALLNNGPVLTIVNINEVWQYYNGTGIIKAHQCDPDDRNHAVSIVGHDFSGSTPHYIVKNSWSKSWGNDGYAKLEAGSNACGVAKNVVTTCVRNCESTMKDTKSIFKRNYLPD